MWAWQEYLNSIVFIRYGHTLQPFPIVSMSKWTWHWRTSEMSLVSFRKYIRWNSSRIHIVYKRTARRFVEDEQARKDYYVYKSVAVFVSTHLTQRWVSELISSCRMHFMVRIIIQNFSFMFISSRIENEWRCELEFELAD